MFSVSNAEFEGGDDGHGHGEGTSLAKQAQPSHAHTKNLTFALASRLSRT